MNNATSPRPGEVCVITVTYGKRGHLLTASLHAAFACGAGKAIVVDNGSVLASQPEIIKLAEQYQDRIEIIRLSENQGSAVGFKTGMEHFYDAAEYDYAWLLDDDNCPMPEALAELCRCYGELLVGKDVDSLALQSLRIDRPQYMRVAGGESSSAVFPPRSSFCSFHVRDVGKKIGRTLRPLLCDRKKFHAETSRVCVPIPFGIYGGLFFHRRLLKKIGYPDERFVLYVDDTEFTWRIYVNGGYLFLITRSIVNEIDQSWDTDQKNNICLMRMLGALSPAQVYFSVRNQVFFESNIRVGSRLVYVINKYVFMLGLLVIAVFSNKFDRFSLICKAICHGEQGELGKEFGVKLP